MITRIACAFIALAVLLAIPGAAGNDPRTLAPGFAEERTLSAGEEHVYAISMEEGSALLAQATQHGVDLVLDIYGPDGKLIRSVDSPNGANGPEPVDLTAFSSGTYKLVIRGFDPKAASGKYGMRVDRLLSPAENGERMAEKNYPPAIRDLWREYVSDRNVVERFIASRKGKGPIVEPIDNDAKNFRVTYLYYGDDSTESVKASAGPHSGIGGLPMQRFMDTPLFFVAETVPRGSCYRYAYFVREKRLVGPGRRIEVADEHMRTDVLNPDQFNNLSVLTVPGTPARPYVVANDSVPRGKLTPAELKSTAVNELRKFTIYTPSTYDGSQSADLIIFFDGETYDGTPTSSIPTPTILDNLIAARKIRPAIAVFVNDNADHDRWRDLNGNKPFADFIATELIPWMRANYRIAQGPEHVVLVGSSLGAVAAAHCALVHPEAIGNVFSQSGAFWVRDGRPNPLAPLTEDSGDLVLAFRNSPRLPIRFYIEVGRFEPPGSMVGTNREFRDVLLIKGYAVSYHEFNSGHDAIWWRGSLAEGLITLLSPVSNASGL